MNAELMLNQLAVKLEGYAPQETLLQFLRQEGYVGTKEGCGDGDCGACTVALLSCNAEGEAHFKAVNSCLLPLGAVAHAHLITVEGLAQEALHPVQTAMVQTGGSQCGYCTPGFIMSIFAAYYDTEVTEQSIEGNLCRCTGYFPIQRAMAQLAPATEDSFTRYLEQTTSTTINHDQVFSQDTMYFYRPSTLEACFQHMDKHPEAVLIAGGTDLGLDLSQQQGSHPCLISLEHIAELQQFSSDEKGVRIGAAMPLSHVASKLEGLFPALDEMLAWFAAKQIRNRATIGGNLATASPIGDLLPVLLALDAVLHLRSKSRQRKLAVADFFLGYRQTQLKKGELIESIEIPTQGSANAVSNVSYSYKIGKRGTDDISIVAAAFSIELDNLNRIVKARLAYGGVAATPLRALDVEQWLLGKSWSIDTVHQTKVKLKENFMPLSDLRASASYRNTLVANLFEKFFHEMASRQ